MRGLRLICFVLIFFTMAAAATLTPTRRKLDIESFEFVWKRIQDRFWDPEQLGGKGGKLDWQAVHDELLPKMQQAATEGEAIGVLDEMIGRLRLTHFAILSSDVYSDLDGPSGGEGTTGLDVRFIEGKPLVTSVRAGVDARLGWEIVRIDQQALAPVLERVARTYANTTIREMMLVRAVTARLSGPVGAPVQIEFLDGQNRSVKRRIPRNSPRGEVTHFGLMPPTSVWYDSRKLSGDVGYFTFNLFLDPGRLMPAFEDAVRNCASCAGMIVDLRGNPGGLGVMSMGMAGFFIEDTGRELGTMYMRNLPIKFVINPRQPLYKGPLAILVDGLSASTSEIFAGGLKDLGRARIFGSRTAGAALPSVIEKLPNGDAFQYAQANYVSEGGKALEGLGLQPDVAVENRRDDLLAGRDRVLQAAVDWVHTQRKAN